MTDTLDLLMQTSEKLGYWTAVGDLLKLTASQAIVEKLVDQGITRYGISEESRAALLQLRGNQMKKGYWSEDQKMADFFHEESR